VSKRSEILISSTGAGWCLTLHIIQGENLMTDILTTLLNLFLVGFIVGSMLSMGASLTMKQITAPLKNTKLVILALAANFVLAPVLGVALTKLFQLETGLTTGLILVSVVAGAPFLPKLAETARGDIAFSVGLMVLLMVVSIIFAPIVLPLLLPGVAVSAWAIAKPLIFMMLIPLAIGLFLKARYSETAGHLQPIFAQISNISLALMFILMLVLNWSTLMGAFGTKAFIAAIIFVVVLFVAGYFMGGSDSGNRSVMGLGTAQRNLGAAMAIAGANFASDHNVIVMIIVVAVIGLVLLMVTAGELGKRSAKHAA
jgi:BASS family bile acid:Na+ symporter